ncbi:MAG: hypothetical protein NZ851_04890 [Aquificaceae bacterium]|nr:hypothetical protein [Aquificaceae bacterium]
MGIFIEDLLNFGNLIDAELEVKLGPSELRRAYTELDFEIGEGVLRVIKKRKMFFLNRDLELRLSEGGGVKKDRENLEHWAFFRVLSKGGLQEILKLPGFRAEGEHVGMEVMKAVSLTDTYQRIPKQFRERLIINRYKIGKDHLSVFFKFEK